MKRVGVLLNELTSENSGSTWSQAKGHMYGSHNLGASKDEIRAVVEICRRIEDYLKIQVNRAPEKNWTWLAKLDEW